MTYKPTHCARPDCGAALVQTHKGRPQKWCSPACRLTETRRLEAKEPVRCRWCGGQLKHAWARACSDSCGQKFRRSRKMPPARQIEVLAAFVADPTPEETKQQLDAFFARIATQVSSDVLGQVGVPSESDGRSEDEKGR